METKLASPFGKFYLLETEGGWVGLAVSARGLRATTLPRASRDDALRAVAELGAVEPASEAEAGDIARRVRMMVEGGSADPSAGDAIDWEGLSAHGLTAFRRAVLEETLGIPAGETRTYGWLAAKVGRPRAARAVGRVMATNPLPLVIPCHRVVAADGTLHGYGGGLPMKDSLLRGEGAR